MNSVGPVKTTNHAIAAKMAKAGLYVFPCLEHAIGNKGTKSPYTANGFKDASNNIEQIDRWWAEHPNALVGLPTGGINGWSVIDCDVCKETGEAVGEREIRALNLYPEDAVIVHTPSGGLHIYFRHVDGVKNTTKQVGECVDTRGEGG